MNEQQFFNVAFAIIGALGGWWMRVMWQSLKELQQQDSKLAVIFAKLDRIEDKMNKKADK